MSDRSAKPAFALTTCNLSSKIQACTHSNSLKKHIFTAHKHTHNITGRLFKEPQSNRFE